MAEVQGVIRLGQRICAFCLSQVEWGPFGFIVGCVDCGWLAGNNRQHSFAYIGYRVNMAALSDKVRVPGRGLLILSGSACEEHSVLTWRTYLSQVNADR